MEGIAMTNLFEEYYNRKLDMDDLYDLFKDDKENGKERIESLREEYTGRCEEIQAEGDYFAWVYRMYESMRQRGNEYLDVDELNDERKIPGLVKELRKRGIQFFVFSSTWSSAIETAWELTKNGCTICGMIEINGKHKPIMKDEYEKAHGLLIRVM